MCVSERSTSERANRRLCKEKQGGQYGWMRMTGLGKSAQTPRSEPGEFIGHDKGFGFIPGEKGSHWILSSFQRIALAPMFSKDYWKGMGRNTLTSQETFAIHQMRIMVAWTRVQWWRLRYKVWIHLNDRGKMTSWCGPGGREKQKLRIMQRVLALKQLDEWSYHLRIRRRQE